MLLVAGATELGRGAATCTAIGVGVAARPFIITFVIVFLMFSASLETTWNSTELPAVATTTVVKRTPLRAVDTPWIILIGMTLDVVFLPSTPVASSERPPILAAAVHRAAARPTPAPMF